MSYCVSQTIKVSTPFFTRGVRLWCNSLLMSRGDKPLYLWTIWKGYLSFFPRGGTIMSEDIPRRVFYSTERTTASHEVTNKRFERLTVDLKSSWGLAAWRHHHLMAAWRGVIISWDSCLARLGWQHLTWGGVISKSVPWGPFVHGSTFFYPRGKIMM